MPRIVFLDKSTVGEVDNFDKLRDFGELVTYETTSREEVMSRVPDAEIIITNKVIIDAPVMDHARSLKLICIAATGMNNVDLDYAAKKNIQVRNVAGYSTHSVAQATFSMLFYLLGHLRYYDDYVRSGKYTESPIFTHLGPAFMELRGKTFGIIGLGTIGKMVASLAGAFEAGVIYYSTSGQNRNEDYRRVELPELLGSSDVVSIHAPLNEKTRNLINLDNLRLFKPSAILINTGRGGIVNEQDLAYSLDHGILSAAALDVLEKEPITKDNPLMKIRQKDRLLIMPHIAWASRESRTVLLEGIYKNIKDYLNAGDPE